jgi:hypothetical protein
MSARYTWILPTLSLLPFLFGFGACAAFFSEDPAPSMEGDWSVVYDDSLQIEIQIGGAVYTAETDLVGGSVTIEHDGEPVTFDLDCEQDGIVCPSEVWAESVSLEQREPEHPNRLWMEVPQQVCDGELVEPNEDECGEDTHNPDCVEVCDGAMVDEPAETFGLISEDGSEFALLLGGGVATNGVNCALLGISAATGDLVTAGAAADGTWEALEVENGQVAAGYGGGCLWAGAPDGDEELEAIVLEATVVLRTGYKASKDSSVPR